MHCLSSSLDVDIGAGGVAVSAGGKGRLQSINKG